MKTLCRWVCLIAFITPSLRAQGPFMNDTLPVTVPAGETNTVVAQTGTGVVDKAGSGLLILQDPGLFNGIVRLREGALHADVSGATPATRPDTILERAAFHVDASAAASITADGAGAVTEWRDLRGAGYPFAAPPGTEPLWSADALNGLPVVDFGTMPFYTGQVRGMHWSREFTNSVKSVFWVLGSRFGGGFLLGATDTYHLHRGNIGAPLPISYMFPEATIFTGYLPDALWRGETQIDRQARNGRTTGLSGAFHLVSLIATNTATDGLTAGRFANDRHFNGQGGGQSLAEVAVFEDILTPAERDAVESYLTDKWFRGPDLRILEIAGTGSVGRADSGTLRVNVLTGTGQVLAEGAVEADTVKLAGALDLAGEGAYAVGLLRGAGTLTASAPILLEHVGLYREALTLAAPLIGASIDTVYGQGALTLDGGIGFSNVRVGDAIAVTNDGTALAVGWLSGQGTFNSSGCGALTVETLQMTNVTLTVQAGANPIAVGTLDSNVGSVILQTTDTIEITALTGSGTVRFDAAASVTLGDVSGFSGTLYLNDCGPVEILGPAGDKAWAGLTVVGNAQLTVPGANLTLGRLYGRGTLTVTNALTVTSLSMTADLTVNDAGTEPWMLTDITGPGTLTLNRPYYAPVITLSGAQVVTLGLSNRVDRVSGTGTLNVPAGAFTIDTLALGGTITFNNGSSPLAIASMTGNGRLVATGSPTTLDQVSLADLQSAAADTGAAALTVTAFSGHGAFRKGGTGAFTFPVPTTLRSLTVEGGALLPVRVSPASIPASVVPAFWVDASRPGTLSTNAAGGVTQWWDVRKGAFEDPWMYAYSENEATAPQVLPASANGLPIVAFGPERSGLYLRWSKQVDPVRTFFMAIGTHEGGGYLLGCSTMNDFIRAPDALKTYRTPLWNQEKFYTRFGRSYVDGEQFAFDTRVPFNGGYQVLAFVDDTDASVNPDLQRGAADQFARYRTTWPDYTGGQRLGEVLICTNVVTEAERAAIESYLAAKWIADIRRLELLGAAQLTLAEGDTLSVDVACGAGRLTKLGAGDLKVSNSALLTGGLDIQAGRLAFARTDRAYALNPVFHVDASADNGSVMTDPYGYVTNWADVRFNGRWAAATNSLINNAPNLLLNALNERPVVDFNYYGSGGSAPAPYVRNSLATERYLSWNAEIANIRTAFWLLGSQNGGGFLLGHTALYNFHREIGTWGDSTVPGLFADSAADGVKNGRIFVDGLKLSSYKQQDVLNGDYQLVQLVTTANAAANQFSRDRTSTTQCGGQRLGEVVLFSDVLTEKERMNMEALLAAKWFGDLRRVALADGTVLDTGADTNGVVLAALEGAGTVRREGAATLRLLDGTGFSGILETRLDRLDVSRLEPPAQPAAGPSLWLDASRPGGVALNGTAITNIRDFSVNNLPIGFTGANPVLRAGELNGRPVIDLGRAVAGGTALTFDGTRARVLSAFAVHGSQEGGGCFLGAATTYPFYREFSTSLGTANPYTPIWHPSSSELDVRQGWTYLDGQNVCGVRRGFSGGYGLFSFIVKPRTPFTTPVYIAGDRGSPRPFGGLRFGEILLYDRVLTDAERQQTEAYLNAKWFGRASTGYAAPTLPVLGRVQSLGGDLQVAAGRLAVLGEIQGASSVSVTGGGKLALASGGPAPAAYQVTAGTLTLSPAAELHAELPVTDALAFWADASRAESLTLKSGSAGEVIQWSDARGAGHPYAYAYADPDQRYTNTAVAAENRIPGGIAITPPTLLPGALNGRPVLDFGPYGGTQWLLWNAQASGIRTVFWVIGSQKGGGHLMSGSGDLNYFLRGTNYLANTPAVLWGANWTAVTGGVTRVDGSTINGLKTGLNGTGYQIVSLTATADVAAGAFACDRPGRNHPDGTRCGGQRLAEVLVYTRALTDAERAEVEAYLAWKWFGRGTPGTSFAAMPHTGAAVDLAPDAELILNGVDTGAVTVTGSGYVANAEVPPTVFQLTGPRVFEQGLILADGATLVVDYDGAQPALDQITVAGGLTVLGGGRVVMDRVSNWTSGTQSVPLISYDTLNGGEAFDTQWRGSGAPFGHSVNPGWLPGDSLLNAVIYPSGSLLYLR